MASNYTNAWLLYLAAVLVAHFLLWWLMRRMQSVELKQVVHLCVLALLITPARLEPGSDNWVPAFMAALMEGIDSGFDAAANRLWPIFSVMLVFIVTAMLVRRWLATKAGRGSAGSSPSGT